MGGKRELPKVPENNTYESIKSPNTAAIDLDTYESIGTPNVKPSSYQSMNTPDVYSQLDRTIKVVLPEHTKAAAITEQRADQLNAPKEVVEGMSMALNTAYGSLEENPAYISVKTASEKNLLEPKELVENPLYNSVTVNSS